MGAKEFISGNEAVAIGARLSRPQVIPAYPISPQTIVVEKLSEYVDEGSLNCRYVRMDSEHSAMSAALGASALGARVFTATSSQGLMYMAEVLPFVSGSRFPVVMMNANRALAIPWSIFNDQADSLMLLNSGWIQFYVEDAQEALDMTIQAFKIAETPGVLTPVMINLDGFILTHTYEPVDIPEQELVDRYLPPYVTANKMSLANPTSVCVGMAPDLYTEYRWRQHRDLEQNGPGAIREADRRFAEIFGRSYGGLVEKYRCDDAEAVLVALGSACATVRTAVDAMRAEGHRVGLFKLRCLRPFPSEEFVSLGDQLKALGVLETDISYGYEGAVYTQVASALHHRPGPLQTMNYIGGLAGREISEDNVKSIFKELLGLDGAKPRGGHVKFINLRWNENE